MMGWFGKIVASPIRLVNLPLVAFEKGIEKATGLPPTRVDEGILCGPLESLAQGVEEGADRVTGEDER